MSNQSLSAKTAQVNVREILESQSVFLSTPTIDAIVRAALAAAKAEPAEDAARVEASLRGMCRNYANEVRHLREALAEAERKSVADEGEGRE